MNTPTCVKCAKKMELGFILDQVMQGNYAAKAEWADGRPERSFWTGVKLKGKKRYPVQTYRCPTCGYLESYAE